MRSKVRAPPSPCAHHVTPRPHNSEVRIVAHHHHPIRPPTRTRPVAELGDILRREADVLEPPLGHHPLLDVLATAAHFGLHRVLRRPLQPLPRARGLARRDLHPLGHRVDPEHETHLRCIPPIPMSRRTEVRVSAQQHVPKACSLTQRDRLIEPLCGSLVRRTVATAIHPGQRFARVRQRHHQRVVAPSPVIGDLHPFLALTVRLGQRPVGFHDRLVEERGRLLLPHLHPHPVDGRHQRLVVRLAEAPREVPRRRRIGNHPCADRVRVPLVVPQLIEILQRLATAPEVVGDVQHVIRLVVGLMHLQPSQARIDLGRQPRALNPQVHGSDPARPQAPHPIATFVLDIAAAEHRLRLCLPVAPAPASFDSSLATGLALLLSWAHLKCPPWRFEEWNSTTPS